VRDEARFRPNEQKRIYGSFAKLNEQVGWQPTIDIDKSLQDVLSYWESKLKHA